MRKSTVEEAERPIYPLTVASIDHHAMQPLDIIVRSSAAITDLPRCSRTHWWDIYILIRPPFIESNKIMPPSHQVAQSFWVTKEITNWSRSISPRVRGSGCTTKLNYKFKSNTSSQHNSWTALNTTKCWYLSTSMRADFSFHRQYNR